MTRMTAGAAVVAAVLLVGCDGSRPSGPSAAAAGAVAAVGSGSQPEPPSNATALAASESQLDVRWQDNSSTEARFEVFRSTSGAGGAFSLLASTAANVTSHADRAVLPSTEYCYRIRAVRVKGTTVGTSSYSNTACAVSYAAAPLEPAAASGAAARLLDGTVYVQWMDASQPGDAFRIERSIDGGSVWSVVGTVPSGWSFFEDVDAGSERAVCYRVVTFNETAAASPSNSACATPPAAPTGLTATAVDAETVDLSWTDDSAVETGYEVRLSVIEGACCSQGSGCESGYSEGSLVLASLPANATTYRVAAVLGQDACGQSRWLEVRALTSNGSSAPAIFTIDP